MCVFCTLLIVTFSSLTLHAATFTFDNTVGPGPINTNFSCPDPNGGAGASIANLERTFNVTTHFFINDLDVGFNANHTWRGDIQLTLISPSGTSVILLAPDTGVTGNEDNWDLALDDAATGVADDNTNDIVADPIYAADRNGQPSNPLSAFNGEDAFGTWTIEICDKFPTQDNGTYNSSQLLFDGNPIVDLSINKTSSSTTYTPGIVLTYTLVVANSGPENASGITVTDNLPNGLTLNSVVTCTATGVASCGAPTFGVIGGTGFSDTNASVNAGAANFLTYTIEVLPSTNMADY